MRTLEELLKIKDSLESKKAYMWDEISNFKISPSLNNYGLLNELTQKHNIIADELEIIYEELTHTSYVDIQEEEMSLEEIENQFSGRGIPEDAPVSIAITNIVKCMHMITEENMDEVLDKCISDAGFPDDK
jgi:hypothetical protein